MSWSRCTANDMPMIECHMRTHLADAMFPMGNLQTYGLEAEHPLSMTFWSDGRNLLGATRSGIVMPVAPDAPDWADIRECLRAGGTQQVIGVFGASQQAHALQTALNLSASSFKVNNDGLSFALQLEALKMPPIDGFAIRPVDNTNKELAIQWRAAYCSEILGESADSARAMAEKEIPSYMAADSHRILYCGNAPVAMTGLNAKVEHMVQVGGVYTPPEHRRQGLARRVVALHLQEARSAGYQSAVLGAASENAARAYKAIGFERRGSYTISLLHNPLNLHEKS